MTKISTDPKLLAALAEAAHVRLTSDELRKQRIDYIVGCLSDEGTSVTRAQVVSELQKLEGEAA
jgi:hypothetical protein